MLRLICEEPVITGGGRKPEYPANTTALPQVTGNFLTYHGWDTNPDSGERQLAVSGNALDHRAIGAVPSDLPRTGTLSEVLGTISETISIRMQKLRSTLSPMFILEPSGGSRNIMGTSMAIMVDGRMMLMM